jgi:hypothetical protein
MFDRHKTLLFLLKLNIKLKVERALVPMLHHDLQSSKYKLPCPVDGTSFKYSFKVKVFCNIDAIAMVSAYPSSPGCFPEPVL